MTVAAFDFDGTLTREMTVPLGPRPSGVAADMDEESAMNNEIE